MTRPRTLCVADGAYHGTGGSVPSRITALDITIKREAD
jgi:hypothetical protein